MANELPADPQMPASALTPDELGVLPLPPAPAGLPPSTPVSQNPRTKLLTFLLTGLAAGTRNPGLAAGALQAQNDLEQQRVAQRKIDEAAFQKTQSDYERQRLAQQSDEERRRQLYLTNIQALRGAAAKATSTDDYDRIINAWAQGLQGAGLRITPQRLRADAPFADAQARAEDVLSGLEKKPSIQQAFNQNPDLLFKSTIPFEGRPTPIGELWKLAGRPVDPQGNPMASPTLGSAEQKSVLLDGKPAEVVFDPKARKYFDLNKQEITNAAARVRPMPPPSIQYPKPDKLIKVEHKDPATGRAVIEWLPESEVRGRTFDKPVSAMTENRLASAEAVNQTGNDIIAKLSDPVLAQQIGPAMGRYNTMRDFIGNPPPEFSELAGNIESYALANMGVHGMRSAQGAKQIVNLLDKHHTPESLIGAIRGLNNFSSHFMENEGRKAATPAATLPTAPSAGGGQPQIGERRIFNGQPGEWDGKGWKPVR